MNIGILYLRPIEVTRMRAYGRHRDAARDAWMRMFDWLDERNYRANAVRGFGLVHKIEGRSSDRPNEASYDACVEHHEGLRADAGSGVDIAYVPGGAYLRTRFNGEIADLGIALRRLRIDETARRGIAFDETRPIIEVYLNDFTRTGNAPKIDLCVPVMI